ncbi:MAG: hypothetical protein JNJ58_03925 [Chitinophagaceae bacterium]|nr:hypothetical protein [Chitinophagaceae bacterium]
MKRSINLILLIAFILSGCKAYNNYHSINEKGNVMVQEQDLSPLKKSEKSLLWLNREEA